ncbi:MAG: transcription repressor NadR [Tissierellia bacterium]|mgnify:CR=1 FL=1|nr:transcription repressor NadR [Tissierellia bacterium]
MDGNERRNKILNILERAQEPTKGTDLAESFNVSRQVIVQDIALLRAKGKNILATPRGYVLPKGYEKERLIKTIVCAHHNNDELEEELRIIVDLGGKIIDVIVDHPLYGEIRSQLQIGSRYDLKLFMGEFKKTKAEPLSSLTGGIHLHTIEVEDEETFIRIRKKLLEKKYLIEED